MKDRKTLDQILFEKSKITEDQLSEVKRAHKKNDKEIRELVVERKFASEKEVSEALSEEIGIPFIDLENYIIDPSVTGIIGEKKARQMNVMPLYVVKDILTVAMADPQDIVARDEVKIVSKFDKVEVLMATRAALMTAIDQNYNLGDSLEDILRPMETEGMVYAPSAAVTPHMLANLAGQPPVVKFVNQMIFDALRKRASDIHVEPTHDKVKVRFRIDGVLHNITSIPRDINLPIVPRLKILAGLDIAERRKPQDGRFTVNLSGRYIDLRVAAFPIAYGETITLRLLDKATAMLDLEELGLVKGDFDKFKKIIKSPYGIVFVTGPTGSGKTTTLYSILNQISSSEKNIVTIEDPIEYLLDNVNQAQVNTKIGLDFAAAIRSFLRQDPDVILVGEVRDPNTAEMALRSSLTGHLVFSTLHTNDAPRSIARLRDLGVDRKMLASAIICVLAQRLVRIICPSCKVEEKPDKALLEELGVKVEGGMKFYTGKGCDDCSHTGYSGRIGIFELLEFNDEVRELVFNDVSMDEVVKIAVKAGMRTLREDGLEKVKAGITSLSEVVRVTKKE